MAVLASVHCNRDRGLEAVTEVSYHYGGLRFCLENALTKGNPWIIS